MTPPPASFKTMIKDGTIKRADAMKARYRDIHVKPDFNLRDLDDEYETGIEDLTAYIMAGGPLPALEVVVLTDGSGVELVDGHRRYDAFGRAIARGMPIEWVPEDDLLRLRANKTGKKADFDVSLSEVLPGLIKRRRAVRAHHQMLLSTPTGRPVTYTMLRNRWEFAREWAALNAAAAGETDLAAEIRAMILRDMRKRAGDLSESDEAASQLLQHSSVTLTKRHYRTRVTRLKPVR